MGNVWLGVSVKTKLRNQLSRCGFLLCNDFLLVLKEYVLIPALGRQRQVDF